MSVTISDPKWYFSETDEAVYINTSSGDLLNTSLLNELLKKQKDIYIVSKSAPVSGVFLTNEGQMREFLRTGQFDFITNLHQDFSLPSINAFVVRDESIFAENSKPLKRIAIIGLGNVGSTLLQGLVLTGPEQSKIEEIRIWDSNAALMKRWEIEAGQISSWQTEHPRVKIANPEQLDEVDIILFCVTSGVPDLGEEKTQDIRLSQFYGNAVILESYLDQLIEADYGGLFAVMSDPVDHLTRHAIEYSAGRLDPGQFVGLGHGVMFARAHYVAPQKDKTCLWVTGTHGDLSFVIDDIREFNEAVSREITEETISMNIRIRELGYMPYVAPGMSSGALSVIALLNEQPFFGATWNGDLVWGSKILYKNGLWGWLPLGDDERLQALLVKNRDKIDKQYKMVIGKKR